jgi:hypothetical protein
LALFREPVGEDSEHLAIVRVLPDRREELRVLPGFDGHGRTFA